MSLISTEMITGLISAVQHERGPRTSTIRKQVALYFRGHKDVNGTNPHFASGALPTPTFFTTVSQLEPHNLELAAVSTPERQTLIGLAQPTPKVSQAQASEGLPAKRNLIHFSIFLVIYPICFFDWCIMGAALRVTTSVPQQLKPSA